LGIDTIFTLVGDHLNEVLAEAARAAILIWPDRIVHLVTVELPPSALFH